MYLSHQRMATGGEMPRRASIFEIVGAWLRLWTPPRDVEIPPVPWKKLAVWTGVAIVAVGAALAVMVPRIDAGKNSRAAKDAAFAAHARAANRARIVAEQRPRHGSDAALKPASGASAAEQAAARTALVHRVEQAVFDDSRARARAGEIRQVEGPTKCSVTPGTKVGAIGVFDCFTITRTIKSTSGNIAGTIGYPYRAVVDFGKYSYTWCKTEQFPGERLIPDPRTVVQLPPACRAPGDN
jgi:hypothetical protein